MIIYGLKTNIRTKVTLTIAVISLVLGSMLFPCFNNLLLNISVIQEFSDSWEYLGVFSFQITAVLIYSIITALFNNLIWRRQPLLKMLSVPDLNGEWIGGLVSSHKENGSPVKVKMKLTIKQTWEKMSCICEFEKSASFGDMICLDTESAEGIILKFTYTNKSGDIDCGMPQYAGYNELRLLDQNTLSGTYFTARNPSTRGTMLLIRQDSSSEIKETVSKCDEAKI